MVNQIGFFTNLKVFTDIVVKYMVQAVFTMFGSSSWCGNLLAKAVSMNCIKKTLVKKFSFSKSEYIFPKNKIGEYVPEYGYVKHSIGFTKCCFIL